MPEKPTSQKVEKSKRDGKRGNSAGLIQALQQAEQWSALLDSIADEIWLCDADGRIVFVNDAAIKGLGFQSREEVYHPLNDWLRNLEVYTPDGRARPVKQAPLLRSLRGEIFKSVHETVLHPKTGEMHCRQVSSSPIRDESGKIIGAIAVVRDVTEQRKTEDALRKSERLLKETQRLTQAGGWELDVISGEVTWTDEVYRIYGVDEAAYDPSDVDQDMRFYAPESRRLLKQAFERAIHHGEPYDLELEFIRADGERIWVRTVGRPEAQTGKIVRISGNFVDITRYKHLEREHQEALNLLENVYDSLDEAVFVVHPESRKIISCNRAAEKIFGYQKEEMVGRNTEFFHLNRKAYREFGAKLFSALDEKGIFCSEYKMRKKDGTDFPTDHTAKEVRDESGRRILVVSVVRDITEPKRRAEQLENQKKTLKKKSRRLEELNTAFRVLLDQRSQDKKNLEDHLSESLHGLILPYLDRIRRTGLNELQKEHIDILESNLREIIKPYDHRLSEKLMNLTPTETRIANLVKQGYRSKEIASRLSVSSRTIEFHRDNIRRKLDIKDKKVNLKTFLSSIF